MGELVLPHGHWCWQVPFCTSPPSSLLMPGPSPTHQPVSTQTRYPKVQASSLMGTQPHSPVGWHQPQPPISPPTSYPSTTYQPARTWNPDRTWDHQLHSQLCWNLCLPAARPPQPSDPLGPATSCPRTPWAHSQPYLDVAPPTSRPTTALEPLGPTASHDRNWPQPPTA